MIKDRDFFLVAKALASSDELGEAYLRSAVSRAYYAAYHRVLAVAVAKGFNYKRDRREGQGSHAALIAFLARSADSDLKKLNGAMVGLKKLRVEADYNLESTVSILRAEDAIDRAEKILVMGFNALNS